MARLFPLGVPGLMFGRPFRPFSRAFSSRNSNTARVKSATLLTSSTTIAFNSAFDRPSKSAGARVQPAERFAYGAESCVVGISQKVELQLLAGRSAP